MSDLKFRKILRDESPEAKRNAKAVQGFQHKRNSTRFYIVMGLVVVCCLGFSYHMIRKNSSFTYGSNFMDSISLKLGFKNYLHSIVIDAGSTGSRILLYGFVSSPNEKSLKLHTEYFREIEPGISAFANNPSEGVKTLESLVNQVKALLPKENWAETPLVMKATAGLRLLPENLAKNLLMAASNYFRTSGFQVDENAVSIMDGMDEGLFSWFSVNFLLNRFDDDMKNTVVSLDLGGGSTQVSFVPVPTDNLTPVQSGYLTKLQGFSENLKIFTHSYLGLGLNEGRKRILKHNSTNPTILKSECISPLVNMKWNHGGVNYTVQGLPINNEKGKGMHPINFEACEAVVKAVIDKFEKAPRLAGKEIYAVSYYYDRAADSGLINFDKGGTIILKDYISAAKVQCREADVNKPFLCLDLVFISVLLKDKFGISENDEIHLSKWIDGHQVTWALGAAFFGIQSRI